MLCLEVQIGRAWPFSIGEDFLFFCCLMIFFCVMALGKHCTYKDLDAIEAMEEMLQISGATNTYLTSVPSLSLGGSRSKKKKRSSDKDPMIPP